MADRCSHALGSVKAPAAAPTAAAAGGMGGLGGMPTPGNLSASQMEQAKKVMENPAMMTTSADMFYIIYTSGSTGKPKGVVLDHLGMVNLITWRFEGKDALTSGCSVMYNAGLAFDASPFELFPALCKVRRRRRRGERDIRTVCVLCAI